MPNSIDLTADVHLTTGADIVAALPQDQLVWATSATLNPSDRLRGGAGTDTLALEGSGDFNLGQLAEFSGFEAVRLNNATGSEAKLWMRSGQDLTVTLNADAAEGTATGNVAVFLDKARVTVQGGAEDDRVYASSPGRLVAGSVIDGGGGSNDYLFLSYSAVPESTGTDPVTGLPIFSGFGDSVYDLTSISLTGVEKLNVSGSYFDTRVATVAKVDTASLADVRTIYGDEILGGTSRLTTNAATLDLTGKSIRQVTVESTNATGTTFTTDSAATAMQIVGGAGQDKVVVTGLTLTSAQRDQIFSGSVETIQDASGTYAKPDVTTSVRLTAGADTVAALPQDQLVSATSATLNSVDRLTGGAGTDTLQLTGSGDFDLARLAEFSGFEAVRLTNTTAISATLTLRDGIDLDVTLSNGTTTSGPFGYSFTGSVEVNLGTGRVTLHGGNETDTIRVGAPNKLVAGSVIDGGGGSYDSLTLSYAYAAVSGGSYDPSTGAYTLPVYADSVYNLTSITLTGTETLNLNGARGADQLSTIVKVDTTSLTDVRTIYGYGNVKLTTDASTLDLTGKAIHNALIESTNASGTTFTTNTAETAMQIVGGLGQDKVVVTGLTLTSAQREQIFAGSVETIQDASGTYSNTRPFRAPSYLDLTVSTINGVTVAALTGQAEVGATIEIFEGTKLLGSTQVDASGLFSFALPSLAAGEHALTAVATTSLGVRTSPVSDSIGLVSGTAAEIVAHLDSYAGRTDLKAIQLTDSHVLPFTSISDMEFARQVDAAALAKIVGGYSFSVTKISGSSTIVSFYTANGELSERVTTETNGDVTTDRYDANNQLSSQTHLHDGVRDEHNYIVVGKPYARQDATYDGADRLVSMTRHDAGDKLIFSQVVHSDGTQTIKNWNAGGVLTTTEFNAEGRFAQQDRFDEADHHLSSETRHADGSREVHDFDAATGVETHFAMFKADKSRVETYYGIAGKDYAEQTASYDAAGKLTEMTRHYGDAAHTIAFHELRHADGSGEAHNYDLLGRETVRIEIGADAARDAFQFTYAGASTTPSTATQTHFASNGAKQWSDTTNADGSHGQKAYAGGVELVSHVSASDILTGFKGGADVFTFGPNFGKDTVIGFETGAVHDILRLDDRIVADYADLLSKMSLVGRDTLITADAGDSILLKNIAPGALTADHIQFVHDGLLV